MSAPLLSVVLPVRNRSGVRLENCLRSLRWQEGLPKDDIEIIVSDLGSAPEHRDAVQNLASTYGAHVRYTPADGTWNKSRALNIGIKYTNGKYIATIDVDMVLAPTFLRVLLDTQDELGGRGFLLCQSRDLPQDTEGRQIHVGDMDELLRLSVMRPTYGVGGVQCAEADWFRRVRGYDEGYKGWGAEDADLVVRAERDGRVVKWVTEQTMMFHQWHPTARYDRPWLVKKNNFRLTLTGWIVRKNWLGRVASRHVASGVLSRAVVERKCVRIKNVRKSKAQSGR